MKYTGKTPVFMLCPGKRRPPAPPWRAGGARGPTKKATCKKVICRLLKGGRPPASRNKKRVPAGYELYLGPVRVFAGMRLYHGVRQMVRTAG